MYYKYKGGSTYTFGYEDVTYTVNLPPIGYVYNQLTGQLEPRPILYEHLAPTDRKVPKNRRRPILPEGWKSWRKEEKAIGQVNKDAEGYRQQEWDRRLNGCWIAVWDPKKKKNQYVYLTGLHYFYCFHWTADFGLPDFRFTDLKIFYLLLYSEEDPFSNGVVLATLRRYGKTAILGCWAYEYTSRTNNAYTGIQSKTLVDASAMFTKSVIYPWRNMVDFFRPIYDTSSTQKKDLAFTAPAVRGKSAITTIDEDESLHSYISYKDAGVFSFDGYKLHRYVAEEPGKTIEANVWDRHVVVRPTTEVGGDIVGQMFYATTVEEMEGKGADGFEKLWFASNPNELNKNGKTKSGLYSIFIPAYEGYKYDDYGRSLINESKDQLLNEREALEQEPEELAKIIRKFPFNTQEAFMAGKGICIFNETILSRRLQKLKRLPVSELPYTVGYFEWDEEIDGDVVFIEDPAGRFLVSHLPPADEQNRVAKHYQMGWVARNNHHYRIGTDPISVTYTDDPRHSKAGAHGFRLFDAKEDLGKPQEEWLTHMYCFEYLNRPEEVDTYFEDMIKACRFYGCQILIESQKSDIMTYFRQRGYEQFVMYRPESTYTERAGAQQDKPGVPSSRELIDMYSLRGKTFINRHGHRIPFPRTIEQLLIFNPQKTTHTDLAVSSLLTLLAIEKQINTAEEIDFKMEEWFEDFNV